MASNYPFSNDPAQEIKVMGEAIPIEDTTPDLQSLTLSDNSPSTNQPGNPAEDEDEDEYEYFVDEPDDAREIKEVKAEQDPPVITVNEVKEVETKERETKHEEPGNQNSNNTLPLQPSNIVVNNGSIFIMDRSESMGIDIIPSGYEPHPAPQSFITINDRSEEMAQADIRMNRLWDRLRELTASLAPTEVVNSSVAGIDQDQEDHISQGSSEPFSEDVLPELEEVPNQPEQKVIVESDIPQGTILGVYPGVIHTSDGSFTDHQPANSQNPIQPIQPLLSTVPAPFVGFNYGQQYWNPNSNPVELGNDYKYFEDGPNADLTSDSEEEEISNGDPADNANNADFTSDSSQDGSDYESDNDNSNSGSSYRPGRSS